MTLDNVKLYLVDDTETLMRMFEWLKNLDKDTVLGFDTETTGLDIYSKHARLRMVQIGDENTGWAIPWHRWSGAIIELLDLWEGRFTAHNLAYDYKVMLQLANYRLPWERFDDTMIMTQINSPGKPAGLKDMTDKLIDPRASAGEKELKAAFKNNGWTWATIPYNFHSYWFYSALDPVLASRLHSKLKFVADKYPEVYDLEFSARRVCTEIEHGGMRIDPEYVAQTHEQFNEAIERASEIAMQKWGINASSTQQLSAKFIEMGAEFTEFTASGAPSVNEEQLKKFLVSDNEDVKALATHVVNSKKITKINSSYHKNFLEMNVDGVLYPNIKTLAARTGRMSVTNPALQTLPSKSDTVSNTVRKSFIPRNPGEVLASCDYSQVEMRLLTHYSKDEALTQAFKTADATGSDFFTEMGRMVFNDPEMKKDDKRRSLIKTLIYGIIYGASVKKSATSIGVPVEEMQEISDKVHAQFPGIKKFMEDSIQLGEHRLKTEGVGYVVLDSGRVLPAEDNKQYTLVNYTLQGTAAELMKLALLRLDAAGLTPYTQMVIHDEVIFSLPEDKVEELFPIIEECMSYVDGEFAVDLLAEPEILGHRWGEGAKYQGS